MGVWTGMAALAAGVTVVAAGGVAQAEDWTMVAGTDEYIVGVDRDSMHVTGNQRSFTTIHAYRVTYDMGGGSWIDYRISEYTADCAAGTTMLMVDTGYRLNQSATVYKDVLGDETTTPRPGSIGGGIYDFVCGGGGRGSYASRTDFVAGTRQLLGQ